MDEPGDKLVEKAKQALQEAQEPSVPAKPEDVHIYYKYEKTFLDIYSKTFDFTLACKEAGMRPFEVRRNNWLMQECKKLERMAKKIHRMNVAKGTHMELLDKFDRHYDELKKDPEKQKEAVTMAGNLARMSDSAMRANGEFRDNDVSAGMQVNINIDLGGQDYADAPIDVTGEVSDSND